MFGRVYSMLYYTWLINVVNVFNFFFLEKSLLSANLAICAIFTSWSTNTHTALIGAYIGVLLIRERASSTPI